MGNGRFVKGMRPWHAGKTKKDLPQLSHPNPEKGKKHPNHSKLLKERKVVPPSQKGSILNRGNNNPMFGRKGEKCPRWKGGITPLVRLIRTSFLYRQWRSDVFTKDNFTCQSCGTSKCWIEAHHIKPFSKIIEEYKITTFEQAENCKELWNINNGQTLCKECHKKITFSNG